MEGKASSRTRLFNGGQNQDGSRDYRTALIDAGIVAGFTFFSSLGGGALVNALLQGGSHGAIICVVGSLVSTGLAFFTSLMASLQIKKPPAPE